MSKTLKIVFQSIVEWKEKWLEAQGIQEGRKETTNVIKSNNKDLAVCAVV